MKSKEHKSRIDTIASQMMIEAGLDPDEFGRFNAENVHVYAEQIEEYIDGPIQIGKIRDAVTRFDKELAARFATDEKEAARQPVDTSRLSSDQKLALGNDQAMEKYKRDSSSQFFVPPVQKTIAPATPLPVKPAPAVPLTAGQKLAQANEAALKTLGWEKPKT